MQETLVVRREQHVATPAVAVFALLTDPEEILRWMRTEAELRPQPAGSISSMPPARGLRAASFARQRTRLEGFRPVGGLMARDVLHAPDHEGL